MVETINRIVLGAITILPNYRIGEARNGDTFPINAGLTLLSESHIVPQVGGPWDAGSTRGHDGPRPCRMTLKGGPGCKVVGKDRPE
jgi:hypothetical protein